MAKARKSIKAPKLPKGGLEKASKKQIEGYLKRVDVYTDKVKAQENEQKAKAALIKKAKDALAKIK